MATTSLLFIQVRNVTPSNSYMYQVSGIIIYVMIVGPHVWMARNKMAAPKNVYVVYYNNIIAKTKCCTLPPTCPFQALS